MSGWRREAGPGEEEEPLGCLLNGHVLPAVVRVSVPAAAAAAAAAGLWWKEEDAGKRSKTRSLLPFY